jgi:hypothetical protein
MYSGQFVDLLGPLRFDERLDAAARDRLLDQASGASRLTQTAPSIVSMQTIKIAARYTHRLLTSLAAIALGLNLN